MKYLFEIICPLKKTIRITESYWNLIVTIKHPFMVNHLEEVENVIADPKEIRESKKDSTVWLYYGNFEKRFICVVCKLLNGKGFVITTYPTDNIKEGQPLWKKE